jgi:hypothetical protein
MAFNNISKHRRHFEKSDPSSKRLFLQRAAMIGPIVDALLDSLQQEPGLVGG